MSNSSNVEKAVANTEWGHGIVSDTLHALHDSVFRIGNQIDITGFGLVVLLVIVFFRNRNRP